MVTFLDLPDELIMHVAELLWIHDRRNMRLVSKRIDYCISPILFETLRSLQATLYKPAPHPLFSELYALLPEPYVPPSEPYASPSDSYALFSKNLSSGKELVFSRCTKKFIILAPICSYPSDRELSWLQLLNNLVPTLINLYSLKWSYWPENYPVSPLVIGAFNSFGSLPNLRELTITVSFTDPFPGFNLISFSNLSSLSIDWEHTTNISQDFISDVANLLGRCPDLDCFTFSIPRPFHPPDAPLSAHIFAGLSSTAHLKLRLLDVTGLRVSADDFRVHLRHLLYLKVLRIMFNRHADAPQQNSQICQLLLDNSIYLDELSIDTTHPTSVLDYLSSYSGLTHLEFRSRYPGADTPEGIHRFFSSVLPLHCSTLRELHLGWSVETPWTREIAPDDLAHIEKCQRLTTLGSYVTVAVGPTRRTDKVLRMWLEMAMKLPRLRYLILDTTCQYPLTLQGGEFLEATHQFEAEDSIIKFAQAAVEKFTAKLVVPFQITVHSPTMGP